MLQLCLQAACKRNGKLMLHKQSLVENSIVQHLTSYLLTIVVSEMILLLSVAWSR